MENTPFKAYKKLYRSRKNRVFAGICDGLGKHFDVDPTWIRLLFILLVVLGGGGFLIYLIMWLIIPLEPESSVS